MLGFAFVLCLSRLSLQTLLVKVGFIMDQLYKMQKNAARHAFPFGRHKAMFISGFSGYHHTI